MSYWINTSGSIYMGDCADGDRAANDDEVIAWREKFENPVLSSVPFWRAKAVLENSGKLDAARASIAGMGSVAALAWWDNAPTLDRASPTLVKVAASLGMSEADLDDLFRKALIVSL